MTSELWSQVCAAFPILGEKDSTRQLSEEDIARILDIINEKKQNEIVEEIVIYHILLYMRQRIAPQFWNKFTERDNEIGGFERFKDAVAVLYNSLSNMLPMLERLKKLRWYSTKQRKVFGQATLVEAFREIVTSTLHSQLPLAHQTITEDFYRMSFKVFCNSDKSTADQDESSEDVVQCGGCDHEIEQCQCSSILQVFHETNRRLIELDLLERLAGDVITNLIQLRIESHVQETCKGSFDTSYISSLESWLDTVVMGWLTHVYNGGADISSSAGITTLESIKRFKQKLSHFLYETYTRTRIEQLFNIIIEYPDSQPAVEDLRICLQKTDLRSYLTKKLQRALETRLLHPGVNTSDVLTAYVAAIRALRQLDPTGVLLETVTQPVRQYLRWRDDTVRCVVTSLTEEGPSELADELVRGDAVQLDEGTPSDEDMSNWEAWNPDPVDADPSKTSKSRRTSDIISMLVNVYGSKELFVNEYRTLLADRLLSQFSYNTEKEIRYLELLKLRFGESQLHYCEVMLKDVYDSKRINAHLHSDPNFNLDRQQFPATAMILSAQFWPPFKEETLELPTVVKEHLQTYTKAFETLKVSSSTAFCTCFNKWTVSCCPYQKGVTSMNFELLPHNTLWKFIAKTPRVQPITADLNDTLRHIQGNRTLCWKPHLGSVSLEIELKDRKINLTVSPIHATIIWHFQTKNQWTIEELSVLMHVPGTVLRRKIAYWQSQGLLREVSTDCFLLVEESATRSKCQTSSDMMCEDEEAESAMASAHDQREEELQVFWSYIVGMLTNLDSMPLERIHQMLKMFASQGPTAVECSLQELRHFLDRKVREHKLLFSGGFYRLPKT